VFVLDAGHEQPESSPVDGHLAAIAELPQESPWPIVLALTTSLVFAMLVLQKFGAAAVMAILCALALVGWHSQEPQES
jgi:hypothetical protein